MRSRLIDWLMMRNQLSGASVEFVMLVSLWVAEWKRGADFCEC